MNQDRRNRIAGMQSQLEDLQSQLEDLQSQIEEVRDEEQEYYDNMPENFQNGDRGYAATEAIEALDEAFSSIEDVVNQLANAQLAPRPRGLVVRGPIHISNGSNYATYALGIDLSNIIETVEAIFRAASREEQS